MFKASMRIGFGLVLAISLAVFAIVLALPTAAAASPALVNHPSSSSTSTNSSGPDYTKPILTLGAAIAIAGGLIGTGLAQSGIGAAGMGIIAERPEKFGQVLVFFVIPETLWIIGLVLGFLLLLQIL